MNGIIINPSRIYLDQEGNLCCKHLSSSEETTEVGILPLGEVVSLGGTGLNDDGLPTEFMARVPNRLINFTTTAKFLINIKGPVAAYTKICNYCIRPLIQDIQTQ